jgi:hypothetical protein
LVYEVKYNTYDEKGFQAVLKKYNAIRHKSSEELPGQNVGTVISNLLTQTPVTTPAAVSTLSPAAAVTPTLLATATPAPATP